MKQLRPQKSSVLAFIVMGALMMVGVEFFVMKWDRPYYHEEEGIADVTAPLEGRIMEARGPVLRLEEEGIEDVTAGTEAVPLIAPAGDEAAEAVPQPKREPQWRRNAVAAPAVPEGFARVVVIIDDLGVDRKRSREILDLPGPLTAAFLPYALNVGPLVAGARDKGHEILIHMPMEPMDGNVDMGSVALRSGMEKSAFDAMLAKAFTAFDGYVGMNNHMGSKLTQDRGAMERLMGRLYENGLLFVDSRTIAGSVAEKVAADHAVPHTGRDVFLDHDPRYDGVVKSLRRVEEVARKQGVAVAIGHPKDQTIRALAEWLPTLAEKKLVLVPVSAVVEVAPEKAPPAVSFEVAPDEEAASFLSAE